VVFIALTLAINIHSQNLPGWSKNAVFALNTTSSGADIRFSKSTDITTLLPFEIQYWNNTDTAVIWVLVDSLLGNTNGDYIRMHWGNSSATTASSGTNVFATSNNFWGVYHLSEEQAGTGTADVYKDATSNANHGDDYIGNTGQTGIIGKGHDFDGANDHIRLGTGDPSTADLTLSTWINWDGDDASQQILKLSTSFILSSTISI